MSLDGRNGITPNMTYRSFAVLCTGRLPATPFRGEISLEIVTLPPPGDSLAEGASGSPKPATFRWLTLGVGD
jgi:hypothetical protein